MSGLLEDRLRNADVLLDRLESSLDVQERALLEAAVRADLRFAMKRLDVEHTPWYAGVACRYVLYRIRPSGDS